MFATRNIEPKLRRLYCVIEVSMFNLFISHETTLEKRKNKSFVHSESESAFIRESQAINRKQI